VPPAAHGSRVSPGPPYKTCESGARICDSVDESSRFLIQACGVCYQAGTARQPRILICLLPNPWQGWSLLLSERIRAFFGLVERAIFARLRRFQVAS
jgi:hypothetical protein